MSDLLSKLSVDLKVVQSSLFIPPTFATAKVMRQGATMVAQVNFDIGVPIVISVEKVGQVKVGDTLSPGASATTLSVTAVSPSARTITVTPLATEFGVPQQTRLIVVSPLLIVASTSLGASGSNPIAADSTGNASGFVYEDIVDVLWAGSNFDSFVSPNIRTTPLRLRRLTEFGVSDNGSDQLANIQNAIDIATDEGIGILVVDGNYAIDGSLLLKGPVQFVGYGKVFSGFQQLDSSADLFIDDTLALSSIAFTSLGLRQIANATNGRCLAFDNGIDGLQLRNVAFENGLYQLDCKDADDLDARGCTFDGYLAQTVHGVYLRTPLGGLRIGNNTFRQVASVAAPACLRINMSGAAQTLIDALLQANRCESSNTNGFKLDGDATFVLKDMQILDNAFNGLTTGIEGDYLVRPFFQGNNFPGCTSDMTLSNITGIRGQWNEGGESYPLVLEVSGAPTATPIGGGCALAYDTTNDRLYVYDATDAAWKYTAVT